MLRPFVADLHVHTVLSPCADYRMVPSLIVARAIETGVTLLAVTDHNSAENAEAMLSAAIGSGVTVLPGVEVESREGVHLLTLFDDTDRLRQWQEIIYEALPQRENVERFFGVQLVVDPAGRLLRVNRRLLIAAVELTLEEVAAQSRKLGAICLAAHVDRQANGLLSTLGFVPEDLGCIALELSPRCTIDEARAQFRDLGAHALVRSSDAHNLEDIGSATSRFLLEAPTTIEITMACRSEQGRRLIG